MKCRQLALCLGSLCLLIATASAETFVFSHLLEQSGSPSQQPGSSESILHFTIAPTQACESPTSDFEVQLWWYDAFGNPAESATSSSLCFPCTITLGPLDTKATVNLNDIIAGAGGYPTGGDYDGYLVAEVNALLPEPDDEVLVTLQTKSYSDVLTHPSSTLMKVRPLQDRVVVDPSCRTWVFDHLLESAGTAASGDNFDSMIFMTYTEIDLAAGDVDVDIYLFDATNGNLIQDPVGGAICGPCTMTLSPAGSVGAQPKVSARLDDLLTGGGTNPFPGTTLEVLALVNATGGDLTEVAVSRMTVMSRTSASDLQVEVSTGEEIAASVATSVEETARRRLGLSNQPNPFNPRTTLRYSLPAAGSVRIDIVDTRGRAVRSLRLDGLAAGDHQWIWDGRDDAGHELPSGVYVARLRSADAMSSHKMALVR